MAATREEISSWFDRGISQNATHMIVVCDTFDHDDYPVFATGDNDTKEKFKHYDGNNMQRVMEVYSLHADKQEQLSLRHCMRLPS